MGMCQTGVWGRWAVSLGGAHGAGAPGYMGLENLTQGLCEGFFMSDGGSEPWWYKMSILLGWGLS